MTTDPDLLIAARRWAEQDPDPETRSQLATWIDQVEGGDQSAAAELHDAFAGSLEFGTAGLRGRLGPGPNRMNRVVVSQAAAALGAYLHDQRVSGVVVIGFDARHNSEVFARDSAEILSGAGFPVLLFDRPTPTPLIPYLIGARRCVAGIVVTASHNPPADNGYKVYLGDGSQIVPPADRQIAEQLARIAAGSISELPRGEDWTTIGQAEITDYVARAASQVPNGPREIRWVHTALHGVGSGIVREVAAASGFPAPVEVSEQATPDPDFPTVPFPNPEEPGAIDRAIALAEDSGADLVIANDPDADRCAVAIPHHGRWRMLTGDEVGSLLGQEFLRRGVRGSYAASIVSGSRLEALAEAHDQPYVATLTGFKWIGRVPGLVFGYEEAIGYCCDPAAVPDKDGITAALHVLALAARAKAAGGSIGDLLDEIDVEYGVTLTDQLSVRVTDLQLISEAMTRLRATPPAMLLGEPIAVQDLGEGTAELPPTDALVLRGSSCRVVVRPSGTEPKLKCYLEVSAPPAADTETSQRTTRQRLQTLRGEMADLIALS